MKYFYVDSTGYVSNIMFGTVSDCLEDIRVSLTLASFSDSLYFNVYGVRVSNSVKAAPISSLYIVHRDGVIYDASYSKKVGDNFVIVNNIKK